MANGAKDRMRDEMGPDFDDVDWKKLDPRQYDPRRIIREALPRRRRSHADGGHASREHGIRPAVTRTAGPARCGERQRVRTRRST